MASRDALAAWESLASSAEWQSLSLASSTEWQMAPLYQLLFAIKRAGGLAALMNEKEFGANSAT